VHKFVCCLLSQLLLNNELAAYKIRLRFFSF